jgi:hypothetical protein
MSKYGGKAEDAGDSDDDDIGMEALGDDDNKEEKDPEVPVAGVTPIDKSMKRFCPNITNDRETPPAVMKALTVLRRKDESYVQCEGTTTIFGNKDCVHRQCYCITKDDAKTYEADAQIFSITEISGLRDAGYLKKQYKICYRHSKKLRIPFVYLTVLDLIAKKLEAEIRGGVIQIRKLVQNKEDGQFDDILDDLLALIPYLSYINRQDAADARSSLKRALDNWTGAQVDDRPKKKLKLQGIVSAVHAQINGTPEEKNITTTIDEESE